MHRTSTAALAVALCSLALPAVAGAATKTVTAGPPVEHPPSGVPKDAFVNEFFPRSIAVRAGDALSFRIAGFHAVNLPVAREAPPALAVPAEGLAVAGASDGAGASFWFNGQPQLILHPSLVAGTPSGGAYDGSAAAASGAPLAAGPPKPWSVKLTKPGTYRFFCIIHPGMSGKVTVLPKGKPVPSAKADAARVRAQLRAAFKQAKALARRPAPKGDVIEAGPDLSSGVSLGRFTPATKRVKSGAPVTLTMSSKTTETHSFTFAREAGTLKQVAQAFIAPLPGSPAGQPPLLGLSAQVVYPSDVPLPPYDGTQHGDGFLNTGILDGDPTSPLPRSATVTFSKPGTYRYICAIHPEMQGKVVVTS
ncbi:MAG TPA: hypothetical protein VFT50_11695 [Baekduia sp.]|nr:hypothetical protein [Baekduia sp.]